MAKRNSAYPRFVPVRTETHEILGKVKIYEFTKYPSPDGDGCQTSFFTNNANVDNPRQFGLKLFNTSIEAFAAYQRQELAAEEGLAPPVGTMIRWIIRKRIGNKIQTYNRWGYETCIADTSKYARQKANILGSPTISKWYSDWMKDNHPRATILSISTVREFWDIVEEYDYVDAFAPLNEIADPQSIRHRMMEIDLVGTQYDDISSVDDVGLGAWKNPRLRLGQTVEEDDGIYMSNDFHNGNIGLWRGNAVCIDFGYHICCEGYRDYDRITASRTDKQYHDSVVIGELPKHMVAMSA